MVEKDDDYDEDDDEDESKEELDKKRGRDLEESIDLLTTKVFSQSLNEEQVVHNDDMDTFLLEYGAGERNIPVSELDSATPGMKNAYTRVGGGPACAACGFEMPKYPGAYPKFCSNCGTKSMQPDDVQVDSSDPGIGIAGESEVQKGSLMEEMGVDDLINKATGVSDSVMLNRGKK